MAASSLTETDLGSAAPVTATREPVRSHRGIRRDVVANLIGRGWTAIMGFVFVPLYVRAIGVEAYALVAFATTLQVVFALLDVGLATTLNRELARWSARGADARDARDLVRTLEVLYWSASAAIAAAVFALAPAIATRWLHPEALAAETVVAAVRLMGIVIALQFPFTLYEGGLLGLRRQVWFNVILAVGATLRFAAVIVVLDIVSPTVETFFVWQAAVAALQTGVAAAVLWRCLPRASDRPRFDRRRLHENAGFAWGMAAISLTAVVLTQADKIALSKILPLDAFGAYALAGVVAGALYVLCVPLFQAAFPRFSQLAVGEDDAPLRVLYRRATQAIACLVLPPAAILVLFGRDVMLLWTHDPAIADATRLVVALLAAGTALNGLMNVPYALMLACGHTALAVRQNVVAIFVFVPTLALAAWRFGPAGAASVWLLLNVGYVTVSLTLLHRHLLRGEQHRWYAAAGRPFLASVATAAIARTLIPMAGDGATAAIVVRLAVALFLTYAAAGLATPVSREFLQRLARTASR
jgi:O-antigen/teichoic acid export membrane protein